MKDIREQIIEILGRNLNHLTIMPRTTKTIADEILALPLYEKEFVEWIKLYYSTTLQQREGLWDMFWCLTEDMHGWDNTPRHFYSLNELYEYWKNLKK